MFCQACGAENSVEGTQFCTSCGSNLAGSSRKGFRQGLVLIVLGLIMIPVWMFIGAAFPPADKLVESAPSTTIGETIAWIVMWMAFVAGSARIAFSLVFEKRTSEVESTGQETVPGLGHRPESLPAGDTFEPAGRGKWKTTSELVMPSTAKRRTSGELS